MKHLTHFAPHRERRYPVLTAIDLMLLWTLNLVAIGLTAFALKMVILMAIAHPTVQTILHRIVG